MAILIAALRNGAARVVPRGLLLGGQAGAADLPAPAAAGAALFPRGACRDGEEPEKGRGAKIIILKADFSAPPSGRVERNSPDISYGRIFRVPSVVSSGCLSDEPDRVLFSQFRVEMSWRDGGGGRVSANSITNLRDRLSVCPSA